jgi:hypothetical protein
VVVRKNEEIEFYIKFFNNTRMGNRLFSSCLRGEDLINVEVSEDSKLLKRDIRVSCSHKTTGVEYKMTCCGKWSSCAVCHILNYKCENETITKSDFRCLSCEREQDFGEGKCKYCGVKWGNYICINCKVAVDELYYRHCDDCGFCVNRRLRHCSKCKSCLCNTNNGKSCYRDGQCGICLEEVKGHFVLLLGRAELHCGHGFHYKCLMGLISKGHMSCPICRTSIRMEDIFTVLPWEQKVQVRIDRNNGNSQKVYGAL